HGGLVGEDLPHHDDRQLHQADVDVGLEVDLLLAGERQERGHLGRQRPDPEISRRAHAIQEIASARDDSKVLGASSTAINVAATSRVLTVLLSSVLIAGLATGEVFAAATPDVGRPAPAGSRRLVVKPAQATPDAPSKSSVAPELVFDGLGPLAWNATVNRNRSTGVGLPSWAALRVLGPVGSESLFVFPPRSPAYLVASWPRQDFASHTVRIFPGYRWIVVETSAESSAVTTAALVKDPGARSQRRSVCSGPDGEVEWETKDFLSPAPLGRDFVLARRVASKDSVPRLSVLQVPGGKPLATWPGAMGWGSSSPLGNFLAVNSSGAFDSTLGVR